MFLAQRTTTDRPELQVCPAPPCNSSTCASPRCRCGSSDIPNGIDPEDMPQMIVITFENAINEWTYSVYENILREDRKNPNGCPIKATFFVSHEWTDYSNVQNLYSRGHEIDVLGIRYTNDALSKQKINTLKDVVRRTKNRTSIKLRERILQLEKIIAVKLK